MTLCENCGSSLRSDWAPGAPHTCAIVDKCKSLRVGDRVRGMGRTAAAVGFRDVVRIEFDNPRRTRGRITLSHTPLAERLLVDDEFEFDGGHVILRALRPGEVESGAYRLQQQ